jgi:hypothetical protein
MELLIVEICELTARTGRSQRFYQTIDIHLFIPHPCKASTSGAYNWSDSASKIRTVEKSYQTRP